MSEGVSAEDRRAPDGASSGDVIRTADGETLKITSVRMSSYTLVVAPRAFEGPGCSVYWGSHGCRFPQGHEGDCWCDCCDCESHPDSGCVAGPPYYGARTVFYGDDAETRGLNTDFDVTEPCGHCGDLRQNDKPDPCLGMLPGVWSACCGHGDTERAYVAVEGGKALYGIAAADYFTRSVRPKDATEAFNSSSPGGL